MNLSLLPLPVGLGVAKPAVRCFNPALYCMSRETQISQSPHQSSAWSSPAEHFYMNLMLRCLIFICMPA